MPESAFSLASWYIKVVEQKRDAKKFELFFLSPSEGVRQKSIPWYTVRTYVHYGFCSASTLPWIWGERVRDSSFKTKPRCVSAWTTFFPLICLDSARPKRWPSKYYWAPQEREIGSFELLQSKFVKTRRFIYQIRLSAWLWNGPVFCAIIRVKCGRTSFLRRWFVLCRPQPLRAIWQLTSAPSPFCGSPAPQSRSVFAVRQPAAETNKKRIVEYICIPMIW